MSVHRRLMRLMRRLDLDKVSGAELLARCELEVPEASPREIWAALIAADLERGRPANSGLAKWLRRLKAGIRSVHDQAGEHAVGLPPMPASSRTKAMMQAAALRMLLARQQPESGARLNALLQRLMEEPEFRRAWERLERTAGRIDLSVLSEGSPEEDR